MSKDNQDGSPFGVLDKERRGIIIYSIMKMMRKKLDWFPVAAWALVVLGLAVNPLFWILVIIGGCIIGTIAYAAVWCLGIPGAIIFLLLAATICFFARKYELC